MAQKINPILLRLQYTNRYFDNSWYSKKYYDKLVTRDIIIIKYINTFFKLLKLPLGRFSIQHLSKKTRLFGFFCYPKISRDSRSKMFGVYNPTFFRNKKIFRKNKLFWTTTNQLVEKNTKSSSKLMNYGKNKLKFLYNKNLWFSYNWNRIHKNLFWINKLFENKKMILNNIYIINLYKKNYVNLTTKFTNNSFVNLKTIDFSRRETNVKIQKNSNDLFLRFFLNLLISTQIKKEKIKSVNFLNSSEKKYKVIDLSRNGNSVLSKKTFILIKII